MKNKASNVEQYIQQIAEDKKPAFLLLRKTISENLPPGFEETISYGMPGFVVPHSLYPAGYHCDPKQALPFISLAAQKNFIALYHMGLYADERLLNWFVTEYPKHSAAKLDMGKSCIRFKKIDQIPHDLVAELAEKMTPAEWIKLYENVFKR